jgi:parallel beta-helix repeat protein
LNGEDTTNTILDGNHSEPIITVSHGKITISGFTIMNTRIPGTGIYILSDYTTISGNYFKNTNNGILIRNANSTTIIDNLFFNNSFAVEMRQSSNNIIKENTFINNFGGIEDSSNGTNFIDTNLFVNNSYCAIQLEFRISDDTIINNVIKNNGHGITLTCHSTLIQNNTIESNKNYGIRLKGKKSVENTIIGNKIHGNLDG